MKHAYEIGPLSINSHLQPLADHLSARLLVSWFWGLQSARYEAFACYQHVKPQLRLLHSLFREQMTEDRQQETLKKITNEPGPIFTSGSLERTVEQAGRCGVQISGKHGRRRPFPAAVPRERAAGGGRAR